MDELVRASVQSVAKKFSRTLRGSLALSLQNIWGELSCRTPAHEPIGPEQFWAVNDVSFELRRGECLGLLGRNGSGKSTLLKMLAGILKPDRGAVALRGKVGALIELGTGFNPLLTGIENIYVNAALLGVSRRDIKRLIEPILSFAELENFKDAPLQSYSSGMRARLGFAIAAHCNLDILLVDEVLAVGDLAFRERCLRHMRGFLENGGAIIFVTHDLILMARIAHRVLVLHQGEKIFEGPIGTAISKFEAASLPEFAETYRRDAGVPELASVRLRAAGGGTATQFFTGDTVEVVTKVISSTSWSDVRLQLAVFSQTRGFVTSFATPEAGISIELRPGENEITLRIEEMPLMVGAYFINAVLFGEEAEDILCRVAPAAHFRIAGPEPLPFGYGTNGIVRVSHTWQLDA
ncbi:MAG: ABC transporter ATP-binding protein [Bdellovibrionales bacterium]|nr:ABC transporter ATP-binding protein [Bdellovibrionales bacterium]